MGRLTKLTRTVQMTMPLVTKRIRWDGPFYLSHLVTNRCNCTCPFCLWAHRGGDELTTKEVLSLYRDLRARHFQVNYVWGGEPLLRADLPELMSWSRRLGFMTVVNTNGYYLEEQAPEIAPNINHCIVSLDYPSERHDEIRGCPGLYRRLIAGVERLRREYPKVRTILNFTLNNMNVDAVRETAQLARDLDVSLYVCPMGAGWLESTGPVTPAAAYRPTDEAESEVAELLIGLKRSGYRINNSYTFLRTFVGGKRKFTCHGPKIIFTVDPNGDVVDCRCHDRPLGNVREQKVDDIIRSSRLRELVREAETCNKCNNPDRIDLSYGWSLRPEPLFNALKVFIR